MITSMGPRRDALWTQLYNNDISTAENDSIVAELSESQQTGSIRFRPDIEGLRAIAVAFVIAYHAGVPVLRGGFIGVDIFFVLSGYLITNLVAKELRSSGGLNLCGFYARRARRLLPAAAFVVVVVCLTETVIASPVAQFGVLKAALATTLYSSNIYFAHSQLDYFAQATAANPLLHTWSLAVEEQFYLAWPILLLLLTRMAKTFKVRMGIIALITVLSFAGCVWLTGLNRIIAYFQLPARAWEFSAGGLASLVSVRWLAKHNSASGWLGFASLTTVILSAAFIPSSRGFPGYIAAIPVLGTVGALRVGAAAPHSIVPGVLRLQPFQYFGRLSYSLYLWHWPVLMIAPGIFADTSPAIRAACGVGVTVLLAAGMHRVVENPIRFNPVLVSRPGLSLGIAALCVAITVGGLTGWGMLLRHSAQYVKFNGALHDVPSFYAQGCRADFQDTLPRLCAFGETSRPQATVVLFGDSHAAQWFPALKDIAERQHWKLVTIIKTSCSPMNVKADNPANPRAIQTCEEWRRLAITKIQEMGPQMVIVSSSSAYMQRGSTNLISSSEWERGVRDTFLSIARRGASVRFIRDTPHADYDIPLCLAQSAWSGHTKCAPLIRSSAVSDDIYQAAVRAADKLANVKCVDLTDTICGGDRCDTEDGGVVIYRDSNHLTATYVRSLASVLQKQLN